MISSQAKFHFELRYQLIAINTVRGKMVPGKMVPRKMVPGEKGPRKNGPWKIGPRKNILQKLFSAKRILGNLNVFFIFTDWFHYTHKKMFDVHLTILHAPNCRTLKESRKVCCRVLDFHRLITFEHSANTRRCSTLTSRFFVFEFWVCCRILGFHRWSHPNIPHTHHDARHLPHDFLFLSFLGPFFRGPIS